jgi:hypothetical protein
VVLRSKTPEMVAQEVWGMLLVHHAIRRLMHQAALDHQLDPDRLCFIRSLRIVRRQVTTTGQAAAIPPEPQAHTLERVTREIAERLLPSRRRRAFPRVVKRKMSNYGVKRAKHRAWPRPTLPQPRRSSSSRRPSQPPSGARAAASPPSLSHSRWQHHQHRTSRTSLSYRH